MAGADADMRNVRLVAQGKQSLEVWKKIKPLAGRAAEVAVMLANNPDEPVKDLPPGYTLCNNRQGRRPDIRHAGRAFDEGHPRCHRHRRWPVHAGPSPWGLALELSAFSRKIR